jgi:hypothetical protein
MYNTKIQCTYHSSEVFVESDRINDDEKDFIRNVIYRQELLDIFCLDDYNETEMDKYFHELYEKIKDSKELQEAIVKLLDKYMIVDKELGLFLLYAYDYMYLTHICVSEFLEFGKISPHNILNLTSILF